MWGHMQILTQERLSQRSGVGGQHRPETLGVFVLLSFVLKMGGQEVEGQLITEHVSIQTPCMYKCKFECVCVHV